MNITLTTTWNPRGELPRLERFSSLRHEVYQHGIIVLPPESGREFSAVLEGLGWQPVIPPDWSWGRYLALQKAVHHCT